MVQRYENESKSQLARYGVFSPDSCFQWFKDTKMKANHNYAPGAAAGVLAVSNGSKILK